MATFTTQQRRFIVEAFARFNTPTEVAELVEEEFGIDVKRTDVAYYDPECSTGGLPSERWQDLHEQARQRYIDNVAAVPISHERVRFDTLQKVIREALEDGDHDTVLQAVKQAAKESGGKFTNKKLLEHRGEVDTGGVLAVPMPADAESWQEAARGQQMPAGNGKRNGDGHGG